MSGHRGRTRGRLISIVVLAVVAASCSSTTDGSPAIRTGEPPTDRIPVIVDADFDASDLAAIAILLRDPAVDVRAITIAGTGVARCQTGRLVTRYVLDEMGAPDIPFGCGRESGGNDAHPFPDAWRAAADDAFGFDIPPQAESGVPLDAVDVIGTAVDESPSALTIVALGPLTNVEDAFAADETLADRLAGVHAMLGTVEAPGNVVVDDLTSADPLEWNAYADPSAVSALFASDVPVAIVPLDATDDVPVPPDLDERLASDHEAAGADLVYELLVRYRDRLRADLGQQLWDELTVLTLTDPDLVGWEETTVTAGTDGRLVGDDAGKTLRYAASADRAAVETSLLEALRRGAPRETPFTIGGSLDVSFDGTTCSVTGTSEQHGLHLLRYVGPAGSRTGAAAFAIAGRQDWDDVLALLPSIDVEGPLPDWLVEGPVAEDPQGSGDPVEAIGPLEEDLAGVVCVAGTSPPRYVPGRPFQVAGGDIAPA